MIKTNPANQDSIFITLMPNAIDACLSKRIGGFEDKPNLDLTQVYADI